MEDTKPRSVVEKLKLLPTVTSESDYIEDDEDYEDPEHYQAFVSTRQPTRRAEMLELVFKDGKRESFAYSHLYRISYAPETGIILHFSEHTVTVRGLRLLPGLRRLQNYRIACIYEANSRSILLSEPSDAVVDSVVIELQKIEILNSTNLMRQ